MNDVSAPQRGTSLRNESRSELAIAVDGNAQCSTNRLKVWLGLRCQHFNRDDVLRQVPSKRRFNLAVIDATVAKRNQFRFAGVNVTY
jgi:hypothetical protein